MNAAAMSSRTPLPIDDVLPAIRSALASGAPPRLVLAAPPGAGKTTGVPLALLADAWLTGARLLLLEPRRLAARLAAERMAATLGEPLGRTVGLSTRIERRVSRETRIEVITDGLFTRRLLADPELSGVGAVVFDEFHERSLNADLGLALALETQAAFRPDLRLVVMSATLEAKALAEALDAPAIESGGQAFPVETVYLGRDEAPAPDRVARAVRRALAETAGSILAFLPGAGEIRRTAERLDDLGPDVIVAPLYGALSPAEQDAAVAPAPPGRRKVVIATDIAESALTIEGVSVVVDAGLARVAIHDPGTGASRLETRRASQASVDQRRGRAGRTRPGVCYRLWSEAETRGLAPYPQPEILTADLSGLALALAEWGEKDPARLAFIDPPPPGRLAAALATLSALGAVDASGALTARGRVIARLPLAPPLAAMIAAAPSDEERRLAADIAALISERGLGGMSSDLTERLARFRADRSGRAATLRAQAARWARIAAAPSDDPNTDDTNAGETAPARVDARLIARVIARAAPHLIARARSSARGAFLLASGRAARLDPADPLAGADWLAVADLVGAGAEARILAAAPLAEADALELGDATLSETATFDPATGALKGRRFKAIGAIIVAETPVPAPVGAAARAALIEALGTHGLDLLRAAPAIRRLQARVAFLRDLFGDPWPDFSDDALLADADAWTDAALGDPPRLDRPAEGPLHQALIQRLSWPLPRDLDNLAPTTIAAPSGARIDVDYAAEGGPRVAARVQAFYGLRTHPTIAAGRVPVVVALLSPAQRPVAVTTDLPGFWAGAYRDMAKDMRARYPKHDWPDDPAAARPHEGRTKARLKSDRSES